MATRISEWTWKQAVAERVLQVVNHRATATFRIDDIYALAPELSALFPRNRHIKEKIRQCLQKLRDDAFLFFEGEGRYRLNLEFDELDKEPVRPLRAGNRVPEKREVVRHVRLRDTLLAIDIKRRYGNICQVCRNPVWLQRGKAYAEGHHLQPLGSPHCGPDVPGNIIVLCPNHHVMFDRGVAAIVPRTLVIRHVLDDVFSPQTVLYTEDWHPLSPDFFEYHYHQIFLQKVRGKTA
jgi:Dam-replacing HTH domain/HNH endonuclease